MIQHLPATTLISFLGNMNWHRSQVPNITETCARQVNWDTCCCAQPVGHLLLCPAYGTRAVASSLWDTSCCVQPMGHVLLCPACGTFLVVSSLWDTCCCAQTVTLCYEQNQVYKLNIKSREHFKTKSLLLTYSQTCWMNLEKASSSEH